MLSFKFSYPIKPKEEYKIRYGLENKPRPYLFNYPVGLSRGKYRFDYDRRESIHVEDDELQIVKWGSEVNIGREISFVKWSSDIDIGKFYHLENILDRKIVMEDTEEKIGHNIFFDLYFGYSRMLDKNKVKVLEIDKDYLLEKVKEKLLDIYKEILFEKTISTNLFLEKMNFILNNETKKDISLENKAKGLNPLFKRLYLDTNTKALEGINKALQTETERMFFKGNNFGLEKDGFDMGFVISHLEMLIEETKEEIEINILKKLDIFREEKRIDGEFIKNLAIEKIEDILSKEDDNDLDVFQGENPYFKKLNETLKEPTFKIIFLRSIYEIIEEEDFTKVELAEDLIEIFKDKWLEKNFESDLDIEDTIAMLSDITIHELENELEEFLLDKITLNKLEVEWGYKGIEEVYEIIIHIEQNIQKLDKEYLADIFIENDLHQLIKKLVIHDVITEEEGLKLEKSFVGKILLEDMLGLDKVNKVRKIVIESESLPIVKCFREININNIDLDLIKKSIEIDVNKEKEFKKVVRGIEIEDDKEKIKFNKRFWFLRATDPFDLKILPFSDYPYSEKPLMFGKNLIPDNWQLDMVHIPKLHEEIKEHPIPWGKDLARTEMELSIEVMIDVINIMILIWSRMFYNFSGYTGSQAVIRFTKILYDWLMLETSLEEMEEKGSTEHYFRCYNWVRWEAEKVAIKAKDDMSLSGNMYIDEWIFELIYYMENHHFDTMPIFDVIQKMDEYRALLPGDDPQGDISFILDKVKGMRHKIIESRVRKNNE